MQVYVKSSLGMLLQSLCSPSTKLATLSRPSDVSSKHPRSWGRLSLWLCCVVVTRGSLLSSCMDELTKGAKTMPSSDHGIYTIPCTDYYDRAQQQQQQYSVSSEESPTTLDVDTSPLDDMDSRKCRWLIDILIGATVVAFLAVVEYGVIPNIPSGFHCGDPSISHKFTGDTISLGTLLVVTVIVPLISLWLAEACNCSHDGFNMSNSFKQRTVSGARLMWYWYKEYLVGLLAVVFITDAAKILVGEPRPHFLDTCRPNVAENCTLGIYIQDFTCTGTAHSESLVKDSTKSFPSGHASISVYTAIFMVWFTQRRVSKTISYLLVPWLQCLCLIWAMGCSFSRITDHRHHWWDVLAGSFLGVIGAYFTVLTFCAGFCPSAIKIETQFATSTNNAGGTSKDNGHIANGNRHQSQSVRRLLSSTSSYNGSISLEDKEPSEVPMA